jgi:hypothetical protein
MHRAAAAGQLDMISIKQPCAVKMRKLRLSQSEAIALY